MCGSRSSIRTTTTSSSRCCISWPRRSWAPAMSRLPFVRSLRGHANVDVKMAEVTAVDPKTRTVTTGEGQSYQGDFLVLAAGSQANFFGTAGADENAFPLYSIEEAQRLRSRILTVFEDADRDPTLVEQGRAEFRDCRRRTHGYGDGRGAGRHDQPHHDGGVHRPRGESTRRSIWSTMGTLFWRRFPMKAHDYAARTLQRKGVQLRLGIAGERGSSRSRAAFRWHVDSNTHGGLGGRADGLAFGGKCRAAAGARRTDRSAAGPHG